MIRQRALLLLVGLLACGVSCQSASAPRTCDICTTSVALTISVQSASGDPIQGATVTLLVRSVGCVGEPRYVFDASTGSYPKPFRTDAAGRVVVRLRSYAGPGPRCVELAVVAPGATASTSLQGEVRFDADWPTQSTSTATLTVRISPGVAA